MQFGAGFGGGGGAGFVWWRWEYRERRFDGLIVEVAREYGVDPCLVKAVMRRESRFDPWVYGRHGEIGLMQVTEGAGVAWWRGVGRQAGMVNGIGMVKGRGGRRWLMEQEWLMGRRWCGGLGGRCCGMRG